jgi:hypothetical protein
MKVLVSHIGKAIEKLESGGQCCMRPVSCHGQGGCNAFLQVLPRVVGCQTADVLTRDPLELT